MSATDFIRRVRGTETAGMGSKILDSLVCQRRSPVLASLPAIASVPASYRINFRSAVVLSEAHIVHFLAVILGEAMGK